MGNLQDEYVPAWCFNADIRKGDTLGDPQHTSGGELMSFDRVIANPPFSLKKWGKEEADSDPYGRYPYGTPPKDAGDLAFIQHMIASLNAEGKMGVVVPHGVLFRGSSEKEIRKGILEDDLLEAVIGLPSALFYGTGIPAALLIINKKKPVERKGRFSSSTVSWSIRKVRTKTNCEMKTFSTLWMSMMPMRMKDGIPKLLRWMRFVRTTTTSTFADMQTPHHHLNSLM